MTHNDYLKIACWNIQGVTQEKLQDKSVIDFIKKYDCVILIETWLNYNVNLNNQYTYCQPAVKSKRGRSKGGIVITMKNAIRKGVKILDVIDSHIVWLKLEKKFFNFVEDLYMCTIYIPPIESCKKIYGENKYELWDTLEKSILKYRDHGQIMLMGDVNSRIGRDNGILEYNSDQECDYLVNNRNSYDYVTNQFGRKLLEMCRQNNLIVLNGRSMGDLQGQFTSFNYNGSAVVDYCIVSQEFINKIIYFNVLDPNHLSDHAPISVCIDAVRVVECKQVKLPQFPRGFKWNEESYAAAINMDQFKIKLQKLCNNKYPGNNIGIDAFCTDFTEILIGAAKLSLKKRNTPRILQSGMKYAKWYNNSLHILKNEVLHTGKLLRKFPNDPHVRGNFILKKKNYKRACKRHKREYMKGIASQLDSTEFGNPGEFWRLLNSLKSQGHNAELPSMDDLINFFKSKTQTTDNFDQNFMHKVENSLRNNPYHKDVISLDQPISVTELSKAISRLSNGKSFGWDLVTNEMLKSSIQSIEKPLLKLLNRCLDLSIYPAQWCQGHIIPIYKSGNKSDPANFRPITISSCLGKVFSSILNNRISSFLEENNIISKVQIGFCKGHRTSDHLLLLKGLIDAYKYKRKHIYSCFVDFRSAFDSVWHSGLLHKLRKTGLSSKIILILQSMYSQINTCVKRDNLVSEKFKCLRGTRQGCNMSPTLFKLFLNDLQNIFNEKECEPVCAGKVRLGCLMFADDVLILSQSAKGLQRSLDNLNNYCHKWQLNVNLKKTKTMIFNCKKSSHTFTFGNQILQGTDSVCYLGFVLTPSGKFQATQRYLYDKACRALIAQRTALKGFCDISVNTELKLFESVIKPVLLYGAEVWGAYMYKFKNNFQSLNLMLSDVQSLMEKLHSRICKYILKVNKSTHNFAARLELGRYPLFINIVCKILNYYINICERSETSVVKIALKLHKSNKLCSWYSFIKFIIEILGLDIKKITKCGIKQSKNSVFNKLNKISEDIFLKKVQDCNKLKLFSSIKTKAGKEKYLKIISNPYDRKAITQIRLSCHKFPIETGRYLQIPNSERFCKLCKLTLGTELHCLLECFHPILSDMRNKYLNEIFNINQEFSKLPRQYLIKYILLFTDETIIFPSVKYIQNVMQVYPN